jgi:hypothetical protein
MHDRGQSDCRKLSQITTIAAFFPLCRNCVAVIVVSFRYSEWLNAPAREAAFRHGAFNVHIPYTYPKRVGWNEEAQQSILGLIAMVVDTAH